MTGSARRRKIDERVRSHGEVSVLELAELYEVSEMTIRRDLEALEAEGLLRRVRGGAISTISRSYEPPVSRRVEKNFDAKFLIAKKAVELLANGETAVIDVGTTTLEFAKALNASRGNTIVTPSLVVASELAKNPNMKVIVTGGIVRHGEMSLIGPIAEDLFKDINADVMFLGIGGLDIARGLTEYSLEDARVKQLAIQASRRIVVLADASKLGNVALSRVAPLNIIDTLVTDADPKCREVLALLELGTTVLFAHENMNHQLMEAQ